MLHVGGKSFHCASGHSRHALNLPAESSQQQACYYEYLGPESATSSSEDRSHHLTGAAFQRGHSQAVTGNRSAAIRFMDCDTFLRSQVPGYVTNASEPIPSYVQTHRPALQHIVASYYRLAAPWLPVISKQRVVDHVFNPLVPFVADAAFLLLCMKLITQPLGEDGRWSDYYD